MGAFQKLLSVDTNTYSSRLSNYFDIIVSMKKKLLKRSAIENLFFFSPTSSALCCILTLK